MYIQTSILERDKNTVFGIPGDQRAKFIFTSKIAVKKIPAEQKCSKYIFQQ